MKTASAMKWCSAATKNVIELSIDQAYAYSNGLSCEIGPDQLTQDASAGYVMLKHQDMHLGLGLLHLEGQAATIESLLPKHWINASPISNPAKNLESKTLNFEP